MLDLAWQNVKTSTIGSCFVKAGISKDQRKYVQSDDDHPFKDLQNQNEKLGDFYPPGTTAANVVSADKNVMSTVPLLTDEELVEGVLNAANAGAADGEEDYNDAALDPVFPKVSDVREAFHMLHDYMLFSLSSKDIQQKLNALNFK